MIYIKYIDAKQSCVPTILFKNLTLNIKVSDNQKSVITQMDDKKEAVDKKKTAEDVRDKVKNMSDEELLKTYSK